MLFNINAAPRGKKNLVKSYGECMNCGFSGELQSYSARQWVYLLYLLPICPSVKADRYVNMCPACQKGMIVSLKKVPAFIKQVRADAAAAVKALLAGKTEFPGDGGQSVNAQACLGFSLGVLRGLQDGEEINRIFKTLDAKAPPAVAALAKGAYLEFKGEPKRTRELYETTLAACPDDPGLLTALGRHCLLTGDRQAACERLEHLLATTTDKEKTREPMLLLADAYEGLKHYDKTVAMYDRCLATFPEFGDNPAFKEAYAKVKKLSGA